MKKVMKSLMCLICVFALSLTCLSPVSATTNDVIFDLTSLGVLNGYEITDDLSQYMTRAEFAKLVVNAMGYSDIADTTPDPGVFDDISSTPYAGAVNLLYELNVLSGTEVNKFSPDAYITYPQAGKIMVNVLGYSNIVGSTDLTAYSMLAGSLGVYKDTNTSAEYISKNDALIIIHNCLDIDIMTKNYGMIGDSYEVVDGKTLKSSLATTSGRNIVKYKGVVTADAATYLYEAHNSMKNNTIEINGKVYKCGFTAPVGLVGMEVNFFVDYTDEADGVITSIAASDRNDVVKFNIDDITEAADTYVKYMISDDKDAKLNCEQSAKIIYNERWDMDSTLPDLVNYTNGTVRLIDNNYDGVYDIVFVNVYTDAIVDRLYQDSKVVYFSNNVVIDNARYVSLDSEDDDTYIILKNANGEDINFEDIKEDNILSIAKSKDGQVISVVVSDKIVTGTVKMKDTDSITIGTDVYDFTVDPEVNVNDHIDAYINFMNKIMYTKKTSTENTYAYVYKTQVSSNLSQSVKASLILPGHVNETKTNSYDEDGASETETKLFFRNDMLAVYDFDSKVTVDGTKYTASDAINLVKNCVVSYTLNSDNKITKLEILEPVDSDTYKTYNQNGKTFSKGSKEGFGISESETMSICVPNNDADEDDILVPVKLLNSTQYAIKAYDVDEDSSIASLVVINETMVSGLPGIVTSDSDVAIVKKVTSEYKDEEIRYIVNLLTKDGEKNYYVSPYISDPESFMSLNKGDLIAFQTVEGDDELNGYSLIQSINSYNGNYLMNSYQSNETCLGTVEDCKYNYVSRLRNRWVDNLTVNYGNAVTNYEIYQTGGPAIFVIDANNNAKTATFDDIQIGDKIFVSANIGTARALVIKK